MRVPARYTPPRARSRDFAVGQRYGLPVTTGRPTTGFLPDNPLVGRPQVDAANAVIIDALAKGGRLLHRVIAPQLSACWVTRPRSSSRHTTVVQSHGARRPARAHPARHPRGVAGRPRGARQRITGMIESRPTVYLPATTWGCRFLCSCINRGERHPRTQELNEAPPRSSRADRRLVSPSPGAAGRGRRALRQVIRRHDVWADSGLSFDASARRRSDGAGGATRGSESASWLVPQLAADVRGLLSTVTRGGSPRVRGA